MKHLLILAGTWSQAFRWANQNGLELKEWRFISDPSTVLGRRGGEFIRVGTWWARKDLSAVMEGLRAAQVEERA